LDDHNEENLILASRTGDKEAYALLVQKHYRQVFLICLGILGNVHDAEDITQETLLKGFQKIKKLREPRQFGAWITKIGRNLCINQVRRRNHARKIWQEKAEDFRQTFEQKPKENPYDSLQGAVAQLPCELRLPLVLYYLDGQSADIVARRLNISRSGVYQKLRTGIKKLHTLLKQGDKNHE